MILPVLNRGVSVVVLKPSKFKIAAWHLDGTGLQVWIVDVKTLRVIADAKQRMVSAIGPVWQFTRSHEQDDTMSLVKHRFETCQVGRTIGHIKAKR